MRQINFLLVFAVCLALVLFSLENTQMAAIQVIPGYEVEAPLAVELILAMGVGAVLAWLFSAWSRLLGQISASRLRRDLRSKEEQIESLEQNLETYKAQIEQQQQLLPASEETPQSQETATSKAVAQQS